MSTEVTDCAKVRRITFFMTISGDNYLDMTNLHIASFLSPAKAHALMDHPAEYI